MDISAVRPDELDRAVDVWEASVRATHDFVSEDDLRFFKPLVGEELARLEQVAGLRDDAGRLLGFTAVENGKVEMLFLDPAVRGQGGGRLLLAHAVSAFAATSLDVNEQNPQAVGFYLHCGFEVVGRSDLDGLGKPYPLLHLRLAGGQADRRAAGPD